MLGLSLSSKLDCSSYIVSNAKITWKKIGALIYSVKFLSSEVVFYLCETIIKPDMEYCCHIWAGVPSCFLNILDILQKKLCKKFGLLLGVYLESLVHNQSAASLNLFL